MEKINQPLNIFEKIGVLLFFFILLIGGPIFLELPIIMVLFSIYKMKKTKSFIEIEEYQRILGKFLFWFIFTMVIIQFLNHENKLASAISTSMLFYLIPNALVIFISSYFLFFKILKRHRNWIINKGIFKNN